MNLLSINIQTQNKKNGSWKTLATIERKFTIIKVPWKFLFWKGTEEKKEYEPEHDLRERAWIMAQNNSEKVRLVGTILTIGEWDEGFKYNTILWIDNKWYS